MSEVAVIGGQSAGLAPVTVAKTLIARAVVEGDADALVELRERASAAELYASRGGARELANDAGEIKVRAERGLGQIDASKNPRGRPEKGATSGTFSLDVRRETRAAWRALGKVAEPRFSTLIEAARDDEEAGVSTARLIQMIRVGGTTSSTTFEVYTPARYVEAARAALGAIDLDPASSAKANETVKAARFFTEDDDGLEQDWKGRVFLNPPYGRGLTGQFVTKLVEEKNAGRVSQGLIVLNAFGFDAGWFQPLWDGLLCFTDHRIRWDNHAGGTAFGSLFVYLGPRWGHFAAAFGQFGTIVRRT